MTTPVSSIVSRARAVLQDTAATPRWADTEFLYWLIDGQVETVNLKPEAYTLNTAVQLAAGTKQTMPTDAVQLFALTRNMGADGVTPGAIIRMTDRRAMDMVNPDWHSETPTDVVLECMVDPLDPMRYYVYPSSVGGVYVDMSYGAVPPALTLGGNIHLPDAYANALLNYLLFRAYSKDAEHAANLALATQYYQLFTNEVVGRAQAEADRNAIRAAG